MKTIVSSIKVSYSLIILFTLSFFVLTKAAENNQDCRWGLVDQNSFPAIMTMIEDCVKENHDKINTWQGKVKIVTENTYEDAKGRKYLEEILDVRPIPNKIKRHYEFTREFALDVDKSLLYENYYPDGKNNIVDVETGRIIPLKERMHQGSGKNVFTPEYLLHCMDIKNRDGVIDRRDVIKQARPKGESTCQSHLPPIFDPRGTIRIFGDIQGQSFDPLGGTFSKYLAAFGKEGGNSVDGYPTITIKECNVGDVKKYKIVLLSLAKDNAGAKVHIFFNLVCSSDTGFNVVSCSTTDSNDRVIEHKTWDYSLINGVYIPMQKNELRFDYNTGNLKEQSTVVFMNQTVNHPINNEVFSYKNLGLKDGDKFIDKIAGKEYKYEDANLVFVKDLPSKTEPNK
ncbi:MAG: hypothetical protein JW947_01380 [Sedimentisphaerales bacterium]|nr:hypothetical protein [Sedimentisphaerales bacterium]